MSMKDKTLHVYLGEETKAKWEKHCTEKGISSSVAIRRLIEQEMSAGEGRFRVREPSPEDAKARKSRFEILLTASEKAAIDARAEIDQVSRRNWIVDAIRERLTREPQPSMQAINALGESNYQLLSIGRNLNQVVKIMNAAPTKTPKSEFILKIATEIRRHTKVVADLYNGSALRWPIEEIRTFQDMSRQGKGPQKRR